MRGAASHRIRKSDCTSRLRVAPEFRRSVEIQELSVPRLRTFFPCRMLGIASRYISPSSLYVILIPAPTGHRLLVPGYPNRSKPATAACDPFLSESSHLRCVARSIHPQGCSRPIYLSFSARNHGTGTPPYAVRRLLLVPYRVEILSSPYRCARMGPGNPDDSQLVRTYPLAAELVLS